MIESSISVIFTTSRMVNNIIAIILFVYVIHFIFNKSKFSPLTCILSLLVVLNIVYVLKKFIVK